MVHVVYYNLPSPYFVERMNVLARRGNLRIEALLPVRRAPDRSWSVREEEWLFPARYLHSGDDPDRAPVPIPELRSIRPDVFVTHYGGPRFALGVIAGRALARRVAVRALKTFDTWFSRTTAREATKHVLFRSIDTAKVSGSDAIDMVGRYGLPSERAIVVGQSIEVARYASARSLPSETRRIRRLAAGLEGCVFLYVGRLHRQKGVGDLVDAYEALAAERQDVSLLIVGDGPEECSIGRAAARLPRVVLLGFVQRSELPDVYGMADVFVFPTLGDPYGHVVEEAMAAGLPVISTSAAGEIRVRLPEGEAGFVVPPANAHALAKRMRVLASDAGLRERLGRVAAKLASERDHTRYAEEFERFVETTLTLPARKTPEAMTARALGWGLALASRRLPASYISPPL